jgi:CRISPR-associated protein Cmr4
MTQPYFKEPYFALTLDPVHVGTGGYRLGHVDNTILRESGTNLPKIPGSSINGVLRAYAAMAIQNEVEGDWIVKENGFWALDCKKYRRLKYLRPKYALMDGESLDNDHAKVPPDMNDPKNDAPLIEVQITNKGDTIPIYQSCAGKGGKDGQAHCGRHDCAICTTFGFSIGNRGSFQGLTQFHDMRILLFPVYTSVGTVWLTSPDTLSDGGMNMLKTDHKSFSDDRFLSTLPENPDCLYISGIGFSRMEGSDTFPIPENFPSIPAPIRNRIVVISERCFTRMVNSNLEVRTSVSIDPETGAAEDGALFTYEAIPRSTILHFEVIYNRPEFFRIDNRKIPFGKENIQGTVEQGMCVMEALGIGGMNTRGMGRLRVLNLDCAKAGGEK